MAPFLPLFVVTLEEQPVNLHDAVDPTWIRRCAPGRLGLPSQQGMHAMVPVGRQLGDGCPVTGTGKITLRSSIYASLFVTRQ